MSDTDTKAKDDAATTDDTSKEPGKKDFEAEAKKWKDLARKHEARAKENADAARELAAQKDVDRSDLDKLNDRVAAAEKRAADAETESRRFQVAASKGLTPAQAKRLVGTTVEELEADADELLETFAPVTGGTKTDGDDSDKGGETSGGRPKEKLRPGADNTAEPEPDVREIVKNIPRDRF